MAPPHPLRRVSTGSLSSLARSQDRAHTSPSGLNFLQPALAELVDEASTLATNIQRLNELHDALGVFNESFAGYLYALKMNAFAVEWPEAPDQVSWDRAPSLVALPPVEPVHEPHPTFPSSPTPGLPNMADMTYATAYSASTEEPPPKPAVKKGPTLAAKKAALAQRKKKETEIAAIIETLPLEYRGSQPSQRIAMEKVISKLMAVSDGCPIGDIVSVPDAPHPKVNKCLIALVAKKLVRKESIEGKTWYIWVG